MENDIHVVGMSTKDPGQAPLLLELVKELKDLGHEEQQSYRQRYPR
uniref:Uncharacterized protein n=1 Tax=Candidatus Kentrum sp. FW TaxID=2126338 RepID=A0A450TV92_9GAMM|nr:MAG: hypothetical protein BECKFW1821C_GA0114237_104025 [Candidatus Kentron sp. FW]